MSLVIDALRIAAIEALRLDPVIAGIVEDRVFDSRIGVIDADDPTPLIAVYTEEDEGEAWSDNNGGPPFRLFVNLVLEIMLQTRAFDEDGEPTVSIPATDRESEAILGALRSRAVEVISGQANYNWALATGSPETVGEVLERVFGVSRRRTAFEGWMALLQRAVIRRIVEIKSQRFKTDESAVRAAYRLVTIKVEVKEDDPQADLDAAPAGPFAALPQPLRAVCEATEPGSSARATCDLLAARLAPGLETPVAFRGVDMTIRPGPKPRPDPTDGAEFSGRSLIP